MSGTQSRKNLRATSSVATLQARAHQQQQVIDDLSLLHIDICCSQGKLVHQ